jgi:hypothetical protein
MAFKSLLSYALRITLIFVLVTVFFAVGSGVMTGKLPTAESEPGLVSDVAGLLIICLVETVTISALILTSAGVAGN